MLKNREIQRQVDKLKELFDLVEDQRYSDFEFQGEWARYLTIRCAGFLEIALQETFSEFVSRAASPHVTNFTLNGLRKIQNPKSSRFIEVTKIFKKNWGERLEIFIEENGRKEAIDSIMNNRHQIAHGRPTGVSIVRLWEYFERSLEVVSFVEDLCNE